MTKEEETLITYINNLSNQVQKDNTLTPIFKHNQEILLKRDEEGGFIGKSINIPATHDSIELAKLIQELLNTELIDIIEEHTNENIDTLGLYPNLNACIIPNPCTIFTRCGLTNTHIEHLQSLYPQSVILPHNHYTHGELGVCSADMVEWALSFVCTVVGSPSTIVLHILPKGLIFDSNKWYPNPEDTTYYYATLHPSPYYSASFEGFDTLEEHIDSITSTSMEEWVYYRNALRLYHYPAMRTEACKNNTPYMHIPLGSDWYLSCTDEDAFNYVKEQLHRRIVTYTEAFMKDESNAQFIYEEEMKEPPQDLRY